MNDNNVFDITIFISRIGCEADDWASGVDAVPEQATRQVLVRRLITVATAYCEEVEAELLRAACNRAQRRHVKTVYGARWRRWMGMLRKGLSKLLDALVDETPAEDIRKGACAYIRHICAGDEGGMVYDEANHRLVFTH